MENMMITTTENREQQPFATFTKVIDGRTFAVRVFFPSEYMQNLVSYRIVQKCPEIKGFARFSNR